MPPFAVMQGGVVPDRMFVEVPGMNAIQARAYAEGAASLAKKLCPKMTGDAAEGIGAVWGEGWFGISWEHPYLWYQEAGIRPFTMHAVAGKVIPMWIDDPTGSEARKNPKAKKRRTKSGKAQILIFRKAAKHGARKTVLRNGLHVSVPASYPGAPGRIFNREAREPNTTPGRKAGAIAKGNVGVRWRHPGLTPRSFMRKALDQTAIDGGLPSLLPVYVARVAKAA